jgi:hypothetical protein|tara:strand:- start:2063 stop:2302 length:240 start_codon:yes stop_codon:yes gene_type:complete
MKDNKEKKAEAFKDKGLKGFNRLRHYYEKVKKRYDFSNFLITLVSIIIIPFFNNIPSQIVISHNVSQHNVQIINVNYEQ